MTTSMRTMPPSSGTLETKNGTATITRERGRFGETVVVMYRDAEARIDRNARGTWSVRVHKIGRSFVTTYPKATSEGECVLSAIEDIDRAINFRKECRK